MRGTALRDMQQIYDALGNERSDSEHRWRNAYHRFYMVMPERGPGPAHRDCPKLCASHPSHLTRLNACPQLTGLAIRAQDTSGMASRLRRSGLCGHPYSRRKTGIETIQAITRDDLVAFHRNILDPGWSSPSWRCGPRASRGVCFAHLGRVGESCPAYLPACLPCSLCERLISAGFVSQENQADIVMGVAGPPSAGFPGCSLGTTCWGSLACMVALENR
jgi:hypothetical protein